MVTATDAQGPPMERPPDPRPDLPERRVGITPVSLFLVLLIGFMLIKVQFVLILILVSLVLATALARPVHLLEKRLMIPRGLAILTLYIGFFGALILFGFLIAPAVRDQINIFVADAPVRLAELRSSWQASSNGLLNGTGQNLLGTAINALNNPPEPQQETAVNVLSTTVSVVIGLFATLVITFYYLMERSFIRTVVLNEMSPRMQQRVARIWDDAEAKVGGWLRGQLTLCLIIGVAAAIGYGIIGVPFWPVLGVWAAITEIIPVLGPWLGGIPAVVLALTVSFEMAALTTAVVVFIQMMENWVLVPRVMRGAVGLTPLTVFIAITAGAEFYGIIGTLLAIPIAAFVQVIVTTFLDERRDAKQPRIGRSTIPAWRWMRVSSRESDGLDQNGPESPRPTIGQPLVSAAGSSGHHPTQPSSVRFDRRTSASSPAGATPGSAPAAAGPPSRSDRVTPSASVVEPSVAMAGQGEAGASVAARIGDRASGNRPATGPKWSPEHLRRSTVPEVDGADVEEDDPVAPGRPAAIGPGDR
jgi:predicted PurR-regulated permease PerM